jgi:hypothetical protein
VKPVELSARLGCKANLIAYAAGERTNERNERTGRDGTGRDGTGRDGTGYLLCVLFWPSSSNHNKSSVKTLYSSKIVDKKELLRTVSNTGIYCPGDKFGTVYLV